MHVLIVFARPKTKGSFDHAVLEEFTRGLQGGGRTYEVVDLCRVNFDPISRERDFAFFADPSIPAEVLEAMQLKKAVLEASGAGPLGFVRKPMAERWLRDKPLEEIVGAIGKHRPKDVVFVRANLISENNSGAARFDDVVLVEE